MSTVSRKQRAANVAEHVAFVLGSLLVGPIAALMAPAYNYSLSLLIFIVPCVGISFWFYLTPEDELAGSRKAFTRTLALLIPMGIILNLLFADNFFTYPNSNAVIGWSIPSLDFFSIDFEHPIPVEEFAFYSAGFVAMLLIYIWGDRSFFSLYRRGDPQALARPVTTLIQTAWKPGMFAIIGVGLAWLCKACFASNSDFPGYLAYLLMLPAVVCITLFRTAAPLINWRAFVFMAVVILLNSVLWEVSLALPEGWWGYQKAPMLGIFIARWSNLPLEAVVVWILAPLTTVVTFEAMRVYTHHPEPQKLRVWRRN